MTQEIQQITNTNHQYQQYFSLTNQDVKHIFVDFPTDFLHTIWHALGWCRLSPKGHYVMNHIHIRWWESLSSTFLIKNNENDVKRIYPLIICHFPCLTLSGSFNLYIGFVYLPVLFFYTLGVCLCSFIVLYSLREEQNVRAICDALWTHLCVEESDFHPPTEFMSTLTQICLEFHFWKEIFSQTFLDFMIGKINYWK